MEQELTTWRRRAMQLKGRRRGRRYPAETKREAAALLGRGTASGVAAVAVSEALGVPLVTLRRWSREFGAFATIQVVQEVSPIRVRLGGLEVELTMDQLAALARRLS